MYVATDISDLSRIIGQVDTGVGFLGAGFLGAGVMLAKEGMIFGVTSASTIWALAAISVCIAVVHAFVAIKLSILGVAIFYGVDLLEEYSSTFTRGVCLKLCDWRNKKSEDASQSNAFIFHSKKLTRALELTLKLAAVDR